MKKTKIDLNGVLLLDKPTGVTSNGALQRLKRIFNIKKAGHTGSLDPLATGMLPICIGEATKFAQYLLNADKSYVVKARLGVVTNTGDAEGDIVSEKAVPELTEAKIEAVLNAYRGSITQIPSMFSAIKHNGVPLYKLAREGKEVERKPRTVNIYRLVLKGFGDNQLALEVDCSKGTYIRTLVEDIGNQLGCGAHVIELRRKQIGHLTEQQMLTELECGEIASESGLTTEHLLPVDAILPDVWPTVKLTNTSSYYIQRGQAVRLPRAPGDGWVKLVNGDTGCFVGVGEVASDGRITPRRLVKYTETSDYVQTNA